MPCPIHPDAAASKNNRCCTCARNYRKAYYDMNGQTQNERYQNARAAAKTRGHEFCLTQTEFEAIVSQPCFYAVQWDASIKCGLDRKDPTKGYTVDNCVPCCSRHNLMKSDIFTVEQAQETARRYQVRCGTCSAGRHKSNR
jgi:hypothetical protein